MGKYGLRVNQKLGVGAFGAVYKRDSPPDEPFHAQHPVVAMKKIKVRTISFICIRQTSRHFFHLQNPTLKSVDEIKILKDLSHKYIVKYLKSFKDHQGSLWIVMEFCDRGNLSQFIKVRMNVFSQVERSKLWKVSILVKHVV